MPKQLLVNNHQRIVQLAEIAKRSFEMIALGNVDGVCNLGGLNPAEIEYVLSMVTTMVQGCVREMTPEQIAEREKKRREVREIEKQRRLVVPELYRKSNANKAEDWMKEGGGNNEQPS